MKLKNKGAIWVIILVIIIVLSLLAVCVYYFFFRPEVKESRDELATLNYSLLVEKESNLPLFMIEEDFNKANKNYNLSAADFRELGVKIARTHGGPFVWDNVEKTKGIYDFTITDQAVSDAADGEISIFASLWPYAVWDQIGRSECKVSGEVDAVRDRVPEYRCKPADMESYKKFVAEMVERYDGDDNFGNTAINDALKDKIRKNPINYWEIDNEVDIQGKSEASPFFVGTLKDYNELLVNTYQTIKEKCSNCQVAIAAPATNSESYYQTMFSFGAEKYFDIYNSHQGSEPIEDFVVRSKKPIWLSESSTAQEVQGKSIYISIIEAVIKEASSGADEISTSMVGDKSKVQSSTADKEKKSSSKTKSFLLDENGQKTDVFYSLKTAAKYLEGYNRISSISSGSITIYKFEFKDKNPVYVAINTSSADQTLNYNLNGYSIYDALRKPVNNTNKPNIAANNLYYIVKN